MDDISVCTPLLAESDAQSNTSTPNAASVTDADKVINTKIDITQVEGDLSEEELLKGLLTDDYCHVCEAVLLFESQRLSHYEGKKHAQKLRVYLQAKRDEKINKETTAPQRIMTTDKDRFCELCNMVFSSAVVAKSHYEGKVHSKNLRKQGLQPPVLGSTEVHTSPSPSQNPDSSDQKPVPEGGMDPTATTAAPSTEIDLKDPNKYCSLCTASFNNPQMALQHYNGRKHQRNQNRKELLKELGDDAQKVSSLMCQMCNLQFNSVEMYQAHMQGNKHQIREKKVIDLCKTQQKVYNTFTDELSDYIQIQKARGINPKTSQISPDAQTEDEKVVEEEDVSNKGDTIELNKQLPKFPPTSYPPHHSHLGGYNPVEGWHPPYQGPTWPSHGYEYNCPPPVLQGSGPPLFINRPTKRRRCRKQSSSSSYSTSSSYSSSFSSSYSSSTSDSDGGEHRRRDRRRVRRSRREGEKRAKDEDRERTRKKQRRQERHKESEERRMWEAGEPVEERRRKKQKNHGKRRKRDKKSKEEDFEAVEGTRVVDSFMPEDVVNSKKETEEHIEADMNVELRDGGQDGSSKPKNKKEKKKMKEKVDTRTEEEKLWDDSILGC